MKISLRSFFFGTINRKLIIGFFIVTIVTMYMLVSLMVGIGESVRVYKNLGGFLFIILFVTAVLATGIGYFISKSITIPLKQITDATKRIEKGDYAVSVNVKTGDELEQLATAFNRSITALHRTSVERQQIDKAKTEFLSITSHELRSPMTPMKAQLQMLMQGFYGRLNKQEREAVEIVLRNTIRLDTIIQDFLEISRIEAARLKFNFVNTRLTDYIERVVKEMSNYLPEKKIKIVLNLSELPQLEVDPDRVMQVLRNLLNNAMKFSPPKSKIIVTASHTGQFITISVKDSGIGIAKKNQKKIFEPFFQEEQTMYREYGGTGLGLAICKGIVESQKGSMIVKSDIGHGSLFSFTVPLKPVKELIPIKTMFAPN